MAIKKKVLKDGKTKYEVIVKVRDKSGKQVMRRKRWFSSEREAKEKERELLNELNGRKTKITWTNGSTQLGMKSLSMRSSPAMFTK